MKHYCNCQFNKLRRDITDKGTCKFCGLGVKK
jgi:hypothetical protein